MIDIAYVQRMARYNRWQNQNLYGVADKLSDEERRCERGAFFGSIHKTLSHLLWADRVWLGRFGAGRSSEGASPQSVSLYDDWDGAERRERADVRRDHHRLGRRPWSDQWLAGDLTTYSCSAPAVRSPSPGGCW